MLVFFYGFCYTYDRYVYIKKENYYFSNYSLQEIAENYEVSRNAVHKQLKEIENKLIDYEDKLNLLKKAEEIREIISDLDDNIKEQIEELL